MLHFKNAIQLATAITNMAFSKTIPELYMPPEHIKWHRNADQSVNEKEDNSYHLVTGFGFTYAIEFKVEHEQHEPAPAPDFIAQVIKDQKGSIANYPDLPVQEMALFRYIFLELADRNIYLEQEKLDRHRICGTEIDTMIMSMLSMLTNMMDEPWMREAIEG